MISRNAASRCCPAGLRMPRVLAPTSPPPSLVTASRLALSSRPLSRLSRLNLPFNTIILSRRATTAAQPSAAAKQKFLYPESLVVYHAGTGRTTFLACLKLTTVFVFAAFCLFITPAYLAAGEPWLKTAGVALCGIVPFVFVAWSTSPFVAFVHVRLPPYARQSRDLLARFARSPPASTPLEITTMNLVGKPRASRMAVADLRPTRQRLGMVNYARDVAAENAGRSWYRFPAVARFNIPEWHGSPPPPPLASSSPAPSQQQQLQQQLPTRKAVPRGGVKEGWVWDEIAASLARQKLL